MKDIENKGAVRVPYAPQQRKKDSPKGTLLFLLSHPLTTETHLGRYAFVANTKIQKRKIAKTQNKAITSLIYNTLYSA